MANDVAAMGKRPVGTVREEDSIEAFGGNRPPDHTNVKVAAL